MHGEGGAMFHTARGKIPSPDSASPKENRVSDSMETVERRGSRGGRDENESEDDGDGAGRRSATWASWCSGVVARTA